MGKKEEYENKLGQIAESLLEPGEVLLGSTAASKQAMFKGAVVAVLATDRRLIVQPVNRKYEVSGAAISIPPERLQSARLDGFGGGDSPSSMIMQKMSITIRIKTTDGEKLKLSMMNGEGPISKLSGGETQRQAVEAILLRLGLIDGTEI